MSSSLLFLRALQSEIAPVNVNKLTIIMGDFNLIKTDWLNSRTVFNHTTADEKLLLFSQHCGFLQVVHEPILMSAILQILSLSHTIILLVM